MSTNIWYAMEPKIRTSELFDGRLERLGVREYVNDQTTESNRCLTDGNQYVWFSVDDHGFVWEEKDVHSLNSDEVHKVFRAIAVAFQSFSVMASTGEPWDEEEEEKEFRFDVDGAIKFAKQELEFLEKLKKYARGE